MLPVSGPSKRIRPVNQCLGDTRLVSKALGTIFDFLFSLVNGKASSDQGTLNFPYFFNITELMSLFYFFYIVIYTYLHIPYTTYTHTNQLMKVTNSVIEHTIGP